MKIGFIAGFPALCLFGVLIAGCGPQTNAGAPTATPINLQSVSPAVGTWEGKSKLEASSGFAGLATALAGDQLEGPSSLTLQANGNGYLKVAKTPERAITWRQDGKKVVLNHVGGSGTDKDAKKDDDTAVATLAEDEKSMTIDLGQLKVSLTKQNGPSKE